MVFQVGSGNRYIQIEKWAEPIKNGAIAVTVVALALAILFFVKEDKVLGFLFTGIILLGVGCAYGMHSIHKQYRKDKEISLSLSKPFVEEIHFGRKKLSEMNPKYAHFMATVTPSLNIPRNPSNFDIKDAL